MLPGWDSLDSVKRIGNAVQIGTLCCWVSLVLFEVFAHVWKKQASLFTTLALVAFGFAVIGEIGNFTYGGRREQLHEESEKALEKSTQWRRLSEKQEEMICSVVPPKVAVNAIVTTWTGDPEAFQYGLDFASGLTRCVPSDNNPRHRMGALSEWPSPIKYGVWIKFSQHDDPGSTFRERQDLAESVKSALSAAGVEISGPSTDTGYLLEIYVGPRTPIGAEATANKNQ